MHPPLVPHFVNNLIQVNALIWREEHAQLHSTVRLDLLQPAPVQKGVGGADNKERKKTSVRGQTQTLPNLLK